MEAIAQATVDRSPAVLMYARLAKGALQGKKDLRTYPLVLCVREPDRDKNE